MTHLILLTAAPLTPLHSYTLTNAAASPGALLSLKHPQVSLRAFATSVFWYPESRVISVQGHGKTRQTSFARRTLAHCRGVDSLPVNPAVVLRKTPY